MGKMLKLETVVKPNAMITVVGRDLGAISAVDVEGIIDYTLPEAQVIIQKAKAGNKYYPFVADDSKIKSLIIMTNGTVYPSTFRVVTLMERIFEATRVDMQK